MSLPVPDFRSPGTGLYANLARLNLPTAESVFDIAYFRHNPNPFYVLAKELYPGNYKPTLSHVFIALLAKKGLLRMLFTQNIDCLEREAGVPSDLIVEAHGSFATQRCIECRKEFPDDTMKEHVLSGEVPHCADSETCHGLVKPDIVFFGESLPPAFFHSLPVLEEADLALVMGTSLTVHPFASLPDGVERSCPRVLFNMERVGSLGSRPDDVLALGDCDANVCKLAHELGWLEELHKLWEETVGEAEVARQLGGIRDRKEKMLGELEELTKKIGAGLTLDDADEDDNSKRSNVSHDGQGRVGRSSEDQAGTSSGSVDDHPDETTAPLVSGHRDTSAATQVIETDVGAKNNVGETTQEVEAKVDASPDDLPKGEAGTKDTTSPVSAPDAKVNKGVQAKGEPGSEPEAAKDDASKDAQATLNKSVL